ncbi:TPA: PcfJ domain-containing protein [Vibrio parahaemolyticus]|nr:PcfJ domain-containing protein [Vibrio parahaemolyticus]HBC3831355.1 PcfJ domain-containing protein [Vibrio parahaemolyticus]
MNTPLQIAVPNTQVCLSHSMLEALTQRYYLPMQEETIPPILSWSELRQWIDSQKWMRMVERCDDKNLDTLVIFGLFRIAKHKRTQVIKMQRKTLRFDKQGQGQWRWVAASYVPKLNMQNCKTDSLDDFQEVLSYALDALFLDLAKQGMVMVELNDKRKKRPDYQSTFDSFDETPRTVYDVDLRQSWERDGLVSRMTAQCLVLANNAKSASRYWYKQVWDFVDKERLSLLMKIRQCSLSQLNYKEVHQFTQIKLDADDFKANERWLPWLRFIPQTHFNQPNLFSYECLLSFLPKGVSKNAIRKINRQPRQVQALLIKARMWSQAELSLVDAIQDYPTSIKVHILNDIHQRKESGEFREHHRGGQRLNGTDFQRYQRVVFRWAQYFKNMIGHVKVRKHREQWQRALRQFDDVLSWIDRESITVHKNQAWYALMQRHDNWIAEINARAEALDAEQDEATWPASQWTSFDSKGVHIEEITLGKRLREEGQEMEHCVFSYLWDCTQQRYRVFSLQSKTERVTLGLYVDPITHRCRYDQLRGRQNAAASNAMELVGKRLINHINKN